MPLFLNQSPHQRFRRWIATKGFPFDEIQEPARALKKHGQTLRGFDARQHSDVG